VEQVIFLDYLAAQEGAKISARQFVMRTGFFRSRCSRKADTT